jgi:preprotein translocase subunit YajC
VSGFLIIVLLLAAFWIVAVMPRRRRMQSHKAMQDSLEPGNEVITAGGLHGSVVEFADSEVRIEIAEGVVVTVDRRAIAAVATEVEVEVEPEVDREAEPAHDPEVEAEPTESAAENPGKPS